MELESNLTVKEAIERPLFRGAKVVAGEGGLNRRVRWVHILEISNIDELIHGEEMILTTGIAFQTDCFDFVRYIEQLVKQNVSCLCIELGKSFREVPEEMIETANFHQFPLIIFPNTVRFVDITQDLHSIIINRHHKMLKELESISRAFHRLTLTSQGVVNVLKLLHSSTQAQIMYYPLQEKPYFIPTLSASEEQSLLRHVAWKLERLMEEESDMENELYQWQYHDKVVIAQPAGAFGKTWSYIVMFLDHPPQEYDYLILDSAALSISQDLLRIRYIEERRLYTENLWVDDLLHVRIYDEKPIKALLGADFKKIEHASFRVCLIEFDSIKLRQKEMKGFDQSLDIHLSLVVRSVFEQHSFLPLITMKNNQITVIAIDLNASRSSKVALQQVLKSIQTILMENQPDSDKLLIGVGGEYTGLKNAHLSYQEAIHTMALIPCFDKRELFFEEIGVFQLLFNIHDKTVLRRFVDRYLGPLIEYDKTRGSELLQTLKVYLDHDGSKQIAAQKLFIVRQSLYYRLDKISELLGEGYMNSENRLALQVALRAYQLLYPGELK